MHFTLKNNLFLIASSLSFASLIGCTPRSDPAKPPGNVTSAEVTSAEAAAPDISPGSAGNPDEEKSNSTVLLGSPDLTGGIPGTGPLTVEVIQDWLAREENHQTIDVELPLGLSAAAEQIQIPDDNPLTRAKIELGRQLYFDTRMSGDGTIACASCHHPDHGYARPDQFGVGIAKAINHTRQ